MENVINQIESCAECEECLGSCPVYSITGEKLFSPVQRLQTVRRILDDETISDRMRESLYNCTKCMACESVCPASIKITKIVDTGRRNLVQKGLGPLDRGKKIIEGILKNNNAVSGNPAKRLAWLPEPFVPGESETLLFLGCLPSFFVQDSAASSYQVLKRLGIDFMILEDEGCCGTYIYEAGNTELAKEYFQKNVDRFTSLGIKKIIVPCNGCLKCFKYFYPEVLGNFPFQISHLMEVVYNTIKSNPEIVNKTDMHLVYQDACRFGRGEGMTEEPRELLSWCGAEVKDMEFNREQAQCCGSGGGVRSLYQNLSGKIASRLLDAAPGNTIVSACPFCTFQLRFTARYNDIHKEVVYFSTIVLNSLKE